MMGARRALPKLTDRLRLGSDGLEVSPICQGMTEDPKTLSAAFEAGINFFFVTADMHWPAYESMRRGLRMLLESRRDVRDSIVVAAASYATQPEFCWKQFEEVVTELPSLRTIDVTIAGGAYRREFSARVKQYQEHRRQRYLGVRAIGSTFHDRRAAASAVKAEAIDIAFIRYNPVHWKARREVFPSLVQAQDDEPRRCLLFNFKSTIGYIDSEERYRQLGVPENLWRPRPTDYYRFALSEPTMNGLLCGLRTPRQVSDLAGALEAGSLNDDEQRYLLDLGQLLDGGAVVDTGRD
jgi:aryl-alcohol dehydrogenase-like predicted oxidoreductase